MKNRAATVAKQIMATLKSIAKAKTLALKSKTNGIKARIVIFSLLRNKNSFVMSSISQKLQALLGQHHHDDHKQKQYNVCAVDSESESEDHEHQDHQSQSKANLELPYSSIPISNMNASCSSNIIHVVSCNHDPISYNSPTYHTDDGDYLDRLPEDNIDQEEDHVNMVVVDAEKYPDLTHSLFDWESDRELEDEGGSAVSVIDIVKNSKQEAGQEFSLEDEIDNVADLFIRRFHRQIRIQKQHSIKRHQEGMLAHLH